MRAVYKNKHDKMVRLLKRYVISGNSGKCRVIQWGLQNGIGKKALRAEKAGIVETATTG